AALTLVAAKELGRYSVRVNAIAPSARTRMTENSPGTAQTVTAPRDATEFDVYHPANNSPLVVALASPQCSVSGEVFNVVGGRLTRLAGWHPVESLDRNGRWPVGELVTALNAME